MTFLKTASYDYSSEQLGNFIVQFWLCPVLHLYKTYWSLLSHLWRVVSYGSLHNPIAILLSVGGIPKPRTSTEFVIIYLNSRSSFKSTLVWHPFLSSPKIVPSFKYWTAMMIRIPLNPFMLYLLLSFLVLLSLHCYFSFLF